MTFLSGLSSKTGAVTGTGVGVCSGPLPWWVLLLLLLLLLEAMVQVVHRA